MSADIWIEQPCRNQSAGELKGDGLIVFGLDATRNVGGNDEISSSSDDGQVATANGGSGIDPVETACMQMNGVAHFENTHIVSHDIFSEGSSHLLTCR